jgi:hypothetical protein
MIHPAFPSSVRVLPVNWRCLPLMREGLNAGWKAGFMSGSRELGDYRLAGIFIGWEVPGNFDVELQLRNLSLRATPQAVCCEAAVMRAG